MQNHLSFVTTHDKTKVLALPWGGVSQGYQLPWGGVQPHAFLPWGLKPPSLPRFSDHLPTAF